MTRNESMATDVYSVELRQTHEDPPSWITNRTTRHVVVFVSTMTQATAAALGREAVERAIGGKWRLVEVRPNQIRFAPRGRGIVVRGADGEPWIMTPESLPDPIGPIERQDELSQTEALRDEIKRLRACLKDLAAIAMQDECDPQCCQQEDEGSDYYVEDAPDSEHSDFCPRYQLYYIQRVLAAEEVPEKRRCRRSGCRQAWPDYNPRNVQEPVIMPPGKIGECPFNSLTPEGFAEGTWTLSRGGRPVPNDTWSIDLIGEDLETIARWQLPKVFTCLFELRRLHGDRERARAIRNALKLAQ